MVWRVTRDAGSVAPINEGMRSVMTASGGSRGRDLGQGRRGKCVRVHQATPRHHGAIEELRGREWKVMDRTNLDISVTATTGHD